MTKTPEHERRAAVRAAFEALDEDDAMLVTMAADEIAAGVERRRSGNKKWGLGEVLSLEVVAALGMFLNDKWDVDNDRGVCYDGDRGERGS